MRSPFPGMDPFIEQPQLWADFHNSLANELRGRLNEKIQPKYFARLEAYSTFELIAVKTEERKIRPDVSILHTVREPVAEYAMPIPMPVESEIELEFELELMSVEVFKTGSQELISVIEILSPVNKQPGHPAHTDYLEKRRYIFNSPVHFVEFHLLRAGKRSPLAKPVPPAPYYIMVSRAHQRPHVQVWPIQISDRLPVVPIPLAEPDPDAMVDLNECLATVYERGAYSAQIDYTGPVPPPRLSDAEQHLVDQLLQQTLKGN